MSAVSVKKSWSGYCCRKSDRTMTVVRYVDISGLTDEACELLYSRASRERKERADRYLRREDRCRCLVAEALLRFAVKQALGLENFTVERTAKGKPYLPAQPDFCFNLSHSGDWVAIVWGNDPVGVDIEQLRSNPSGEQLARRCFCSDEQAYLFAASDDERTRRFFELWTMKESYLKYLGTGIDRPLSSFSVLKPQGLEVQFDLSFPADAVLAVCAQSRERNCRQLPLDNLI